MPYRLPLDDLSGGFAALARREAKRLAALQRPPADTVGRLKIEVVHDLRKSVKRLRALLLLARTHDNDRSLREADRRLRNLNHQFGPERESAVMVTTLERFIADGTLRSKALATHLRAALRSDNHTSSDCSPVHDMTSTDDEALPALAAPDFTTVTMDTVIAAAGRTYTRARRARRGAERDATSANFHDWRKHVQRHARHMQLLTDVWPDEMAMRRTTARALSEHLGDDHDLAAFDQWLGSSIQPGKYRPALTRLRSAIAKQQSDLRQQALALGARLFAERGRAFRARLAAYPIDRAGVAAAPANSDAAEAPVLVAARRLVYDRNQGDGDA